MAAGMTLNNLVKSAGEAENTDGMYAKIEQRLGRKLKLAFKAMQDNIAEDVQVIPRAQSNAPWMAFAQTEGTFWEAPAVTKDSQAGKKRVGKYFGATDLKTDEILPSCAAFVAFCVDKAGLKEIMGKDSQTAANWRQWGNVYIPLWVKDVPPGAVVVLSPSPGTERSGRVDIFPRFRRARAAPSSNCWAAINPVRYVPANSPPRRLWPSAGTIRR